MWAMTSNLLNINFIHGDIHGRSCKKFVYLSADDKDALHMN